MSLESAARAVVVIVGGTAILYFGRPVLVPLAVAAILAMVLNPLLNWLRAHGVGRLWAITLCLLVLVGCAALLGGLISMQVAQVAQDWPEIQQSLIDIQDRGERYLAQTFNMSPEAINQRARRLLSGIAGGAASFFGSFLSGLVVVVLTLAYIVLMLAERDRFVRFVTRVAPARHKREAENTLGEMANVAYQYLTGKLKVMGIMAGIYGTAFLIAGVPYAIFLAIIIALSSIVPYLGNFLGGVMAVLLTLVSSGPTSALVVLGILGLAQVVENYFLEPLVVGRDVDLSPFMTVFAIVALGTVWGVAGAVLAVPLAAMVKVISSHVSSAGAVAALMQADE